MPPVDYAQYRKIMPPGGVANIVAATDSPPETVFLTDANGVSYDAQGNIINGPLLTPPVAPENVAQAALEDPVVQQYLAERRAAAEPWSDYFGSIATNARNTAQGFLPTALGGRGDIGITDIAKGAAESAYSGATLPGDVLTGRMQAFDPVTGRPTEELVQRGTDLTGMMTLGAGAIPAEGMVLRSGLTPPVAKTAHPKNPEGSVRKAEIRSGGLYSKAEDVLQNWDQKEGTFEQFKAYLKKSGVKQPEIEALTKNYQPGERVNKAQLINTLMAEEPEVRVVETPSFSSGQYNMPGGTNYRMMNITWDNPVAGYKERPYRYDVHELPDNTLVHARLKDDVYTGADGVAKKVLRVEELQSDWAQQGEGGFALPVSPDRVNVRAVPLDQVEEVLVESKRREIAGNPNMEARYRKLGKALANSAAKEGHDTFSFYRVSGVKSSGWEAAGAGKQTPENILENMADFEQELDRAGTMAEPMDPVQEMQYNARFGQAPAPYVAQGSGGVVPLATKRLLVEAAQNGQDEIVIAPGAVHAERWARSDPERAEGLKAFYDSILPKEMGKVLKDVEKESGIKGLKIEAEERPFVVNTEGRKKRLFTDDAPDSWFNNQPMEERARMLGMDPPQPDDAAAVENYRSAAGEFSSLLNRVAYRTDRQNMTPEQAISDLAVEYNEYVESTKRLLDMNNSWIENVENRPYDQWNENTGKLLEEARDRVASLEKDLQGFEEMQSMLPKALDTYRNWKKSTEGGNGKAWVIKLSPDLRDYINKNGLPRFAKGGIVDLAVHGALA